jgi:hypothetical protein
MVLVYSVTVSVKRQMQTYPLDRGMAFGSRRLDF